MDTSKVKDLIEAKRARVADLRAELARHEGELAGLEQAFFALSPERATVSATPARGGRVRRSVDDEPETPNDDGAEHRRSRRRRATKAQTARRIKALESVIFDHGGECATAELVHEAQRRLQGAEPDIPARALSDLLARSERFLNPIHGTWVVVDHEED
ncbi:MAG: hypothetical protein AAFU73_03925 [Planctomycetota bacterium]